MTSVPLGIAAECETTFRYDVLDGLSQPLKTLPCKYLYDERGSRLFDQICELDEYYLTRAELELMQTHAASIADQVGSQAMLVEYGSGSSVKTRSLLDSIDDLVAYVPVDISKEHLLRTADALQSAYPEVDVRPVVADFTQPFELPQIARTPSHVAVYFPGSTIGNFTTVQAGELLRCMSSMVGPQGGLLIGIDLQKEIGVVEAAYNDAEGVTAEFNLNLLWRINAELDGNFDLDRFEHKAVYNEDENRVEISIRSLCDQDVLIGDREIRFHQGEEILTEYSHKYKIDGFAAFASQFGFSLHKYWTDRRDYFAVLHLVVV